MPTGLYKRRRKNPEEELRKRFRVDKRTKCWEWTGHKQTQGSGDVQVNGVLWVASRLSWTVFKGQIPKGKNVLHHCDSPGCINPDHLFLGTQLDNARDMIEKGRGRRCPWTPEQRARRGAAAKEWWLKATSEQKAAIHCVCLPAEHRRWYDGLTEKDKQKYLLKLANARKKLRRGKNGRYQSG